jgi:hypothetical protein
MVKIYGSIPIADNPQKQSNLDGLPFPLLSWNFKRTAVLVGLLLTVAAVLLLNLAETLPRNVVLDETDGAAEAEPLPADVQDIMTFVNMDEKRDWYSHFHI